MCQLYKGKFHGRFKPAIEDLLNLDIPSDTFDENSKKYQFFSRGEFTVDYNGKLKGTIELTRKNKKQKQTIEGTLEREESRHWLKDWRLHKHHH